MSARTHAEAWVRCAIRSDARCRRQRVAPSPSELSRIFSSAFGRLYYQARAHVAEPLVETDGPPPREPARCTDDSSHEPSPVPPHEQPGRGGASGPGPRGRNEPGLVAARREGLPRRGACDRRLAAQAPGDRQRLHVRAPRRRGPRPAPRTLPGARRRHHADRHRRGRYLRDAPRADRSGQAAGVRGDGHPDRSDAHLGHPHALGPFGDARPRQPSRTAWSSYSSAGATTISPTSPARSAR